MVRSVASARKESRTSLYSSKVFLGGVPWDLTDKCLSQAFRQFGTIKVQWPKIIRAEFQLDRMMSRWNGQAKAEVMGAVCPRVMSMLSWRGKVLYLRFFLRYPTSVRPLNLRLKIHRP